MPLTTATGGLLPVHNLDTGENFSTIQAGIDDADTLNGHTITVDSGRYYENVNVNKQLILRGIDTGSGKPVMDAGGTGSAITLSAGNSVLEGFAAWNSSSGWPNAGIKVNSNNNNIKNNTASNNWNGIYMEYSNNNMLSNNMASNNYNGISLNSSSNNTLIGNNASNNYWDGIYMEYSSNNILSNNNALNNYGTGYGNGIYIFSSSSNKLSSNNISNNYEGIALSNSDRNTFSSNNASDNYFGIALPSSNNNTLSGNSLSNNTYGIYIESSRNNVASNNTVLNNLNGISLYASSNNLIYNNYFNNTNNAWDNGNNIWNTTKTPGMNIIGGPYLGGNYWSDYSGKDTDGDGLGDTLLPYNSSGNITNGGDFLPLTITPTPTTGGISGYKINDTNGNGKWDAGEKGISNWTIRLIGIIGKGKNTSVIRKETFTDAMGFYKFDNLQAGRYFVIEKLKKGFVPTNSTVKRIKLAQGENSMNNNFTNRPAHRLDKIDSQRDIDDYEAINRDIDKYKEEMN